MLVRSIRVEDSGVQLEVRRAISSEQYEILDRYIDLCQQNGFPNVSIRYARNLPKRAVSMIRELKKTYPSINVTASANNTLPIYRATNGAYEYHCRGAGSDQNTSVEYVIRFSDFQTALDQINNFVLLIGASIPLDEKCLTHLQFCLYELVANTVEHASFKTSTPEIQVELFTGSDYVEVVYRDNSEPFRTSDPMSIDIHHKIKEGEKRGLGLFLLHQITTELKHDRIDKWNHTTFRLTRNFQPQEA